MQQTKKKTQYLQGEAVFSLYFIASCRGKFPDLVALEPMRYSMHLYDTKVAATKGAYFCYSRCRDYRNGDTYTRGGSISQKEDTKEGTEEVWTEGSEGGLRGTEKYRIANSIEVMNEKSINTEIAIGNDKRLFLVDASSLWRHVDRKDAERGVKEVRN